ncbi:hypothetical protein BJV78DRAFT_1347134 [Lactifluus subvellereus]|nr:hypothetical protein BJV78DRAFT_1347134 [Lactifluus subvellereus]
MTTIVLPPTAQLPPIKTLKTVPVGQLQEAIQYLKCVYNPEIRSSRRITVAHGPLPSPERPRARARRAASHESNAGPGDSINNKAVEAIRADAFEHAYAMRWLTALVSQTTNLQDDHDHDHDHDHDVDGADADADADRNNAPLLLEPLVQSAAALLAMCAGPASAGTRTRTYVLAGVRVQLTDVALRNDDFGSVGAQTWGSACVLAEMIAEAPSRFGLCDGGGGGPHRSASAGAGAAMVLRVLELGAGTGLVSLTAGNIVASDFHPLALENLRSNIENNNNSFSSSDSAAAAAAATRGDVSISAHFLDWEEAADPAHVLGAPFDAPFDEAFGADVVYEPDHAAWINACLKRLLRLTGRFHLVIPLREGFARELASVERVFPQREYYMRSRAGGGAWREG